MYFHNKIANICYFIMKILYQSFNIKYKLTSYQYFIYGTKVVP